MEAEIFKTFLERCTQNHKQITIRDYAGYHSGYITQVDDEVIEMTIEETDKSCIIFRKNIISIEEVKTETTGTTPGPIFPPVTVPWTVQPVTNPWVGGTITAPNTSPGITYRATNTVSNISLKDETTNAATNI